MLDKCGQVRQGSIRQAVQLAQKLMKQYHIPPANVVRHYDVTHKICPAPMVNDPALWKAFQNALSSKEEKNVTQEQFNQMMDNWLKQSNPLYDRIENVPNYLQEDTSILIKCGALRGEEGHLNIRHEQLRAMSVAKRYADMMFQKLEGADGGSN